MISKSIGAPQRVGLWSPAIESMIVYNIQYPDTQTLKKIVTFLSLPNHK